jgi:hypothetical protein
MSASVNSRVWLSYFKRNAANNLALATPDDHVLTDTERRAITASIQVFQIGEASEGHTLQRFAETFAAQERDADYAEAVRYFIREENRHSGYLRVFMQEHRIPRAKSQWTDGVFRVIRRLAGLELSIRVLVTAEMIAVVYYEALGRATGSRKLATICQRMMVEELTHVSFQMGAVARLKARRARLLGALGDLAHGVLMAGTTAVVWMDHRSVLKSQHQTFGSFFRACWRVFADGLAESRVGLSGALPRHETEEVA